MKKNVLFIMVDQMRGDCLSAVGHPHLKTPNLDALANDGVLFKQHYAQATPCGPSRASVYTGLYMHNHRSVLNGTPLDARHTNVALEARKSGYDPALFGYTDTCLDPRQFSSQDWALQTYENPLPGFSPVCHVDSAAKDWLADLKEKGYKSDSSKDMLRPVPATVGINNKGKTFAPAKFKAEDSRAAFLVKAAIKYLSVRQDKPWFMHVSFLSPHPPYIAPSPFNEQYNADDMSLPMRQKTPEKEASLHPWIEHYIFNQAGTNYTDGADPLDNVSLSDLELRQMKATYLGMISEIDSQVGRLINYLKEIDVYDNTLIIFTSDHGDMQGDHWMLSKPGPFDQSFHIPLIIRDPSPGADKSRGTQVKAFTESIDIMPTILDAIGQDVPTVCDGYSLLPFCYDQSPTDWRQEYHAEFDLRSPYDFDDEVPLGLKPEKCMVNIIRGERYKYVHFSGLPPLFFDLKDDPNEYINRYNDPKYQSIVLEYVEKLLTWRMEHDEVALTDIRLGHE